MRSLTEDPIIRELVAQARASILTRRTILSGAAAGSAALALAACAPLGSTKKLRPAKDHSATVKSLTWANWPLYLDQADDKSYPTLAAFEKQTGLNVKYDIAV